MEAVEEIINVPQLMTAFSTVVDSGRLQEVMDVIVAQSKVEFNYSDQPDEEEGEADLLDE